MNKLLKYWNKISDLGVDETIPYLEQRKIKVLNRGIFIGLIFQSIVSSSYLINFKVEGLVIGIVIISILLLLLYLNSKQYFNVAQLLVNILFPFVMLSIGVLYGEPTGIQYNLMIFITTAFFFHKKTITKFLLAFYNILIFFFLEYYWTHYDSIYMTIVSPITEPLTFITSVCCSITIMFTFLKENENFDAKNQELLKTLEINNQELKVANKELERFAYVASHDLKTPLRTILGFTELLERDYKNGKNDNFLAYFKQIKQGTLQMDNLIKTTLEYSRIDNLETENTWIDLNQIIKSIKSNYLNNKTVSIEYDTLPSIFAEENQILSLFQNLIENGTKYNQSPVKKINISCKTSDNKYLFSVSDNGIGIEKQYQNQIFTMFKRLHTNQQYDGTGLGLAICEKVVAKMNGKIWIESKVGVGTTFFVELERENKLLS